MKKKKLIYFLIFISVFFFVTSIFINSYIGKKFENGFSLGTTKIQAKKSLIILPFVFNVYKLTIINTNNSIYIDTLKYSSIIPFLLNNKISVKKSNIKIHTKKIKKNSNKKIAINDYIKHKWILRFIDLKKIKIKDINININNKIKIKNLSMDIQNFSIKKIKQNLTKIEIKYNNLSITKNKLLKFSNKLDAKINISIKNGYLNTKSILNTSNNRIKSNQNKIFVNKIPIVINTKADTKKGSAELQNSINSVIFNNDSLLFKKFGTIIKAEYDSKSSILTIKFKLNKKQIMRINYNKSNSDFSVHISKNTWDIDKNIIHLLNKTNAILIKSMQLSPEKSHIVGNMKKNITFDSIFVKLNGICFADAISKYRVKGFHFSINSKKLLIDSTFQNIKGRINLIGSLKGEYLPVHIIADTTNFATSLFFSNGYIPLIHSKVNAKTNKGIINGRMDLEFKKGKFINLKHFLEGHKSKIHLKYNLFNLKNLFGINLNNIDGSIDINDSNFHFRYEIKNKITEIKYKYLTKNDNVKIKGKANLSIQKFNFSDFSILGSKNIILAENNKITDSLNVKYMHFSNNIIKTEVRNMFKKKTTKIC